MVSNVLTTIAYIFLVALIVYIGRECWKDTKNDFRRLYREAKKEKSRLTELQSIG